RQHRDGLYLFTQYQGQRTTYVGAHVVYLSANQVVRGRPAAAIRNVGDIDADGGVEQRTAQVRRRAGPRRTELQARAICLHVIQELGKIVGGKVRACIEHHRLFGEQGERGKISDCVVSQLFIDGLVVGMGADAAQQKC